MAAKPKATTKSGTKTKSDLHPLPKNDYAYLSNEMISDIGIGIHITQNGKFVFVSPLLSKLSGYSKSTLLGENSLVHVHPEDRNLVKEKAVKSLKSKRKDNYEYRVIKKNGEILWLLEMVVPIQFNGQRAVLGSFMDITEHKKEELALREIQNKQGEIMESIEEGYYEVDLAGNLTFVNDAIIRTWGYSRKELLGMSYRQITDAENAKKLFQSFNEVYRTGNPVKNDEWAIVKKDGTSMLIEASVVPHKDSSGNITGFRGVGRDITERKRSEEALRQSEEKYRTIMESIQEGYFEVDLAGNFTFCNDSHSRILGYPKEALIGMNHRQVESKEVSKRVFLAFNEIYRTGESNEALEWDIIRKDGTNRCIEASVSLRKDPTDKPIGFRGIARDITERKRSEEALRQSEEKYRTILESIEDGYFETDIAGNFVLFNDALCRIFAYSREELTGMGYKQYTDRENGKKLFQVFNECYRTGKPNKALDIEFIRKDKAKAFMTISVSLVRNQQGDPIGFRGISRDITERKQSEEALHQSEEKHRSILENIREAYFEVDLAGNIIFLNDSLCRLTGRSKEELMGANYSTFSDKETSKIVFQTCNRIYKTGEPAEGFDWQFISKDGSRRDVESSISLRKDPTGKPIGFRGVLRDVTERKRMEEELRQNEEKHRNILESIVEGYFEVDVAGNFTFFNDSMCRIWGYPREEMMGMNNRVYTDKENAKKLYQTFNEVYRTGISSKAFDWQVIQKDGSAVYIEATISLRKDSADNIIGFKGTVHDITERKRMEEELRRSEEQYRSILENIRESYFEVDLAGNFTFFNDSLCRLTGCTREELVGMNYGRFSDKETSKTVFQTFHKVFLTGEPAEGFDWLTTRKDGIQIYVSSSISLRKDPAGKPIGFRGVLRDVTERKRMEETLRQSEEKYRSILEGIEEGYYEIDLAGNLTFFNDSLCRIIGYPKEELLGMNFRQYECKETVKNVLQKYNEVYKTGEPVALFDRQIIRKDGTTRFAETSILLRQDSSGTPIGFRGIARDVTDRKRMEEALRQSEEKYRSILENIRESYFEVDLAGNFTFFNDSLCRLTGCTREELVGMNYAKFSDKEASKTVFQTFHKVFLTGEPAEGFDWLTTRKDGIQIYVSASISLLKDSAGKPVGFRGVLRDVTERKRMEEFLRQSEERHRSIIEQMHDGYFEIDLAGNFVHFNEAACRTYGYSKEELMGLNYKQYTYLYVT